VNTDRNQSDPDQMLAIGAVADRVGLAVSAIRFYEEQRLVESVLDRLPSGRTPTESDWQRLAKGFAADIDSRIAGLQSLRERLDGCIGCGCLSLNRCALYNQGDQAFSKGAGPRYLLGDRPPAE